MLIIAGTMKELRSKMNQLQNDLAVAVKLLAQLESAERVQALSLDQVRAEVRRELGRTVRKGNKRKPRQWTQEQKEAILAEVDSVRTQWGGVTSVLRKHNLSSANVTQWRHQLNKQIVVEQPMGSS